MFIHYTLFYALLAAAAVVPVSSSGVLARRQEFSDIPHQCLDPCNSILTADESCPDPDDDGVGYTTCFCNTGVWDAFAPCYACALQVQPKTPSQVVNDQNGVNILQGDCRSLGIEVPPVTLPVPSTSSSTRPSNFLGPATSLTRGGTAPSGLLRPSGTLAIPSNNGDGTTATPIGPVRHQAQARPPTRRRRWA